jgi:glycine dehydrogenase subunit 1
MRYIPNSPQEREDMLRDIGLSSIEDLFKGIPEGLRKKDLLDLPAAVSEPELIAHFRDLAARNASTSYLSFLGGGAYSHYAPVIIDTLISRSEFYTAYTPYQPEVAQGTLQAIFEFQTMICQLTGMEIANASMYDGSTALAEAFLMASRVTRRTNVVVAESVHPEYRQVVDTILKNTELSVSTFPFTEKGTVDLGNLKIDDSVAAVAVQSPNFFGSIEDLKAIGEAVHKAGALFVVVVAEPMSLALLKTPGACGADIVVGEGQSFGVPVNFGGPYVGFFASKEQYVRNMPGRLIGQAYDKDGNRGFVITLSTREQHIKREKATSNICTNEGLVMTMATMYLETMGRRGLQEVAHQNLQKTAYAIQQISKIDGYSVRFDSPVFNEFALRCPKPANKILARLLDHKIIGGIDLGRFYPHLADSMLICITELAKKEDIDRLAAGLAKGI